MSEPLRINIVAFGRLPNGKVDVASTATITLFNRIDPKTGHWESVGDRLDRFRTESDNAMFKITGVDKLNPTPVVEEELEAA